MRPSLLVVLTLCSACRRGAPLEVRADPADASPKFVDASPKEPARPALARFALVMGRVVDLDARRVTHTFAPKPTLEAVHGDRGYMLGTDGMLRAVDLASGAELWSVTPPATCRELVAARRHAYCIDDASVTAFAAKDAAATTLATARAGSRAAVIETERRTLVFGPGEVRVYDAETLAFVTRHAWPSPTLQLRPFATPEGPCATSDGSELFVACLDDAGEPRWASSFPLAKRGAGSPWFHATHDEGFVLASSAFGAPKLGVVVRLDGTEIARVADEVLAPVARPAAHGAIPELEGVIVTGAKEISLLEPSGARRWSAALETFGERGRAILDGDTIVLAEFSSIASGCSLVGLDRASGRIAWTGDVLQLPIAHSAYFNEVELERRPGGLVRLSGHEAGIRYEQLFEIATGKRVFAEAQLRW